MPPTTRPAAKRRLFQPLISASMWSTIFDSVWKRAGERKGKAPASWHRAPDGTVAPQLTNGEVITLVMGWLAAAGKKRFPLWYQFAAAAYGWGPRDELNTSAKQRDAWYPDGLLVELWSSLVALTNQLDDEGVTSPRLDLDGQFDDVVFQGEVRAALIEDGATAQWKIPLPACRDPKTGKPTKPRASCPVGSELRMVGNPPVPMCVDTKTGKRTNPTVTCEPLMVDIDPLRGVKRAADNTVMLVLLILGAWAVFDNRARRQRRY